MSGKREPITYKGRSLGILTLTVAQLLIGALHLAVGVTLLAADLSVGHGIVPYNVYTIAFAVLVLVFAAFIWQKKKAGWVGTVAVSLFVIAADGLTVLNLPSIPGIPKFAAPTEIVYSFLVLAYLLRNDTVKKYLN